VVPLLRDGQRPLLRFSRCQHCDRHVSCQVTVLNLHRYAHSSFTQLRLSPSLLVCTLRCLHALRCVCVPCTSHCHGFFCVSCASMRGIWRRWQTRFSCRAISKTSTLGVLGSSEVSNTKAERTPAGAGASRCCVALAGVARLRIPPRVFLHRPGNTRPPFDSEFMPT
jgi:hypothetical protein